MVQRNLKIIGLFLGALMLFAPFTPAQAKDFVLVIDAGHGGHVFFNTLRQKLMWGADRRQ